MYSLTTSITIDGEEFSITENGDFRMVLDCFKALGDEEMSEDFRVLACLLIFYNKFNSISDVNEYPKETIQALVTEMYKFFNCGREQTIGVVSKKPLIDWDGDSNIICSAINNVAGKEVRAEAYLHWWTFMGYYMAVGESVLSTVVSIRNKIITHQKLEKWEQDFKKENPEYFVWKSTTVEDRELTNIIQNLWNQGGE